MVLFYLNFDNIWPIAHLRNKKNPLITLDALENYNNFNSREADLASTSVRLGGKLEKQYERGKNSESDEVRSYNRIKDPLELFEVLSHQEKSRLADENDEDSGLIDICIIEDHDESEGNYKKHKIEFEDYIGKASNENKGLFLVF